MASDAIEYRGETKERKRWVAVLLSFLCPGLAYMYVGELLKGITVNMLFLLLLESFVIAFSALKFFPLLPALVLVTAWIVFCSFVARSTAGRIESEEREKPYVLKGYNQWMIYSVVFILTFFAPIWVTGFFVSEYLLKFETVQTSAMYPTVQAGDTVLIDASTFRSRDPARGELVAVRPRLQSDERTVLRVVGVENDVVRIEGETVWVNDEPLERSALPGDEGPARLGEGEADLLAMVEHNHGNRYVISVSPRAFSAVSIEPIELGADEFFVLADNRSQAGGAGKGRIRDSRNFGPVELRKIEGKPLYIAWSVSPDTGELRTQRIGLQTQ